MRLPFLGACAATMAAVSALTRPHRHPHVTATGETDAERDRRLAGALPAGRAGTVAEAAAVLWLASPKAGFTVGHVIDGGATA